MAATNSLCMEARHNLDFTKQITKYVEITNKKEQMPPLRLITLTRGIQIRGQPIENYKKKI